MRIPRSTYRLQITADDTLQDAAGKVAYLQRLGADWVYLSPLLQATSGSGHGYDVVDHAAVDRERGGEAGLQAVAEAAHARGLGVLVDIVPNHVGVSAPTESVWWWDLLGKGRDSVHAEAFDVDWAFGNGRIRIPVLGDDDLSALEIVQVDGEHRLGYYDNTYPLAAGSWTSGDDARAVHDRQHYELVNWRREGYDLNYRRFFAVSTLAAVRVELPRVFADSHVEIRRWIEQGWVDGLRVDHPDGLADPGRYLEDLAELTGGRYVLVEKILENGEELLPSWQTAGTTGYDTLAVTDRVLVDPAGERVLDELDARLRGAPADWHALVHDAKRAVADGILRSEVLRLARLVPEIDRADDAIAELLACFPVYRSYLPEGADHVRQAVDAAVAARPDLAEVIELVASRLEQVGSEVSVRFQQTSGMVMAKGVEDCSFYRWTRLTSLTEVGAEPNEFAVDVATAHARFARRQESFPAAMTTLSTHDTKRAEDVRARITVLSESADDWADFVTRALQWVPLADGSIANLLLQAAVGAWPIERERLHAYAEKAAREAQTATDWLAVDEKFEQQMHAFVDALYDHPELAPAVEALATRLTGPGRSNSLAAKLIQLAGTGVPDVYQGTEIWDNSLVDPDNRRPVDHAAIGDLLQRIDNGWRPAVDSSGAAKLLVTSRALRARRDLADLFTRYTPVAVYGPAANHVMAFDRGGAIAVVTRLPVGLAASGGWQGTTVSVPDGDWVDLISGSAVTEAGGGLAVQTVLAAFPVALLVPADRAATVIGDHAPRTEENTDV
ncbi:MAG: malto-oligosyltrehalose synthase [Nakamurella sp.]